MDLSSITSPTLLIDEDKCRANIQRMVEKAEKLGLKFKPHFKTHQSSEIGNWFKEEGVSAITASSLKMAEYFASNGWKNITVAFPVNLRAIDHINELGSKIDLSLLINDQKSLSFLKEKLATSVCIYIEIDTGDNRTGINTLNVELIKSLADDILSSDNMAFSGFYSHPGHSYACQGKAEVEKLHKDVLQKIRDLKNKIRLNQDSYSVCLGDTPCCSLANNFEGINEISPGNFIFYDVMQTQIGSCLEKDIAVALACPVVAKFDDRQEIVVHGGAVHLSKEFLQVDSRKHFGLPVMLKHSGWGNLDQESYVKSLSQEHGIIKCSKEFFKNVSTGDLIGVLPVHSCLTANLMSSFTSLNGREIEKGFHL